MVNNLRDIAGDAAVGKRTLAVARSATGRPGSVTQRLSASLFSSSLVIGRHPTVGSAGAARAPPGRPRRARCSPAGAGAPLIGALQGTGLLTLATGVLLGAGLALSG